MGDPKSKRFTLNNILGYSMLFAQIAIMLVLSHSIKQMTTYGNVTATLNMVIISNEGEILNNSELMQMWVFPLTFIHATFTGYIAGKLVTR